MITFPGAAGKGCVAERGGSPRVARRVAPSALLQLPPRPSSIGVAGGSPSRSRRPVPVDWKNPASFPVRSQLWSQKRPRPWCAPVPSPTERLKAFFDNSGSSTAVPQASAVSVESRGSLRPGAKRTEIRPRLPPKTQNKPNRSATLTASITGSSAHSEAAAGRTRRRPGTTSLEPQRPRRSRSAMAFLYMGSVSRLTRATEGS